MASVCKCGLMVQSTKDRGSKTERVERESFGMLTATCLKVNSETISQMVLAFTRVQMARDMRECGSTTSSMVKAQPYGQMEAHIQVIITKAASQASVPISGPKETLTAANGKTTRSAGSELTNGPTDDATKATGRIISCTDKVFTHGLTAVSTTGNTKMIKKTAKVPSFGQTGVNTTVYGKTDASTVKALSSLSKA